ncbi:hypothetical protein [Reinekea marinisedimentorum]|uniref:Chromosome segregation ATPase n=1 Tax=Reinekea marinisedimentorum TaxID=230495 RepID=A0A4R3I7B2_9GAMM|nr:hypothetical protein [Reinekea marinisedimentorum]TCS40754.1 hypothetical protein BCF53_108119 [Reinekea marinisedimentorum]
MSSKKNKELFEAVCFFGKKSIIKEMRYSEFEAVLDGVVGIAELANKEINAAYVKINQSLQIHSLVMFQIEFNERGFADEDWNIPLRHLAENAGPGPDLGAGPIRLACRSQCSVSWYQRELWEPNQRDINHFQLLKEAVQRNKLGLIASETDIPTLQVAPVLREQAVPVLDVPVVSEKVDVSSHAESQASLKAKHEKDLAAQSAEYQNKIDLLVQMQKQTLQGIEEKYREEIDQVKRAMRNEAQSVRYHAQELEQQANQNKVLLEKLQAQNAKREKEYYQLSERAEIQKEQYDQLKDEYLELLRNQRSEDDDRSLQVNELKDLLSAKSVELDEINEDHTRLLAMNTQLVEQLEGHRKQVTEADLSNSEAMIELKKDVEQKQTETAQLKAQVTALTEEKKRLLVQMQSAQKQVEESNSRLEQLVTDKDAAVAEKIELKTQLKRSAFKLEELAQSLQLANAEGEKLRQELEELGASDSAMEALFDRMEKLELVFVAYHAGAGHISLPARQLEDYLEKPLAFAAQKCAVTLEHYKSWLLHYDTAECEECGIPVKRIDTPSDYQPGIHNRCSKHRLVGENVAMFRKSS